MSSRVVTRVLRGWLRAFLAACERLDAAVAQHLAIHRLDMRQDFLARSGLVPAGPLGKAVRRTSRAVIIADDRQERAGYVRRRVVVAGSLVAASSYAVIQLLEAFFQHISTELSQQRFALVQWSRRDV